jgi:hypothetical protein
MHIYRIPEHVQTGFKNLIRLSPSDLLSLQSTLQNAKVGESPTQIAEKNSSNYSISLFDLERMLTSLFSIVNIYLDSKNNVEEFSKDFAGSFSIATNETNKGDLDALKNILIDLLPILSSSTIPNSIKAKNVLIENSNNFLESRIVSDIRIVYDNSEELSKEEQMALVVHHLRIRYFNRTSNSSEFFVSLTITDLKELSETIKRAIQKDELIRANTYKLTYVDIQ